MLFLFLLISELYGTTWSVRRLSARSSHIGGCVLLASWIFVYARLARPSGDLGAG